jgi:isopenicillin-N N-acyltransferase like protein
VIPVVDLPAGAWARGAAHGEALRELVLEGVDRWKADLAELGVPADVWIARFLQRTKFRAAVERAAPELLEEIAGLAAATGIDERTMFAYQLVDEQWAQVRREAHEHCSTVGVACAGGERPPIVAQNLDLPVWYDGLQVVLRMASGPDAPAALVVTSAGFVAMNGMNEHGVGIAVNALPDVPAGSEGLPVAFVIRGALRCRTASEAVAFMQSVPHASGQHYLVGDQGAVVGVEADAFGTAVSARGTDTVLHTNHALARDGGDARRDLAAGALANSQARLDTLEANRQALASTGTVDEVVRVLSVPGIRRVPTAELRSSTFATVVFELARPPVLHVRGGPAATDVETVALPAAVR